MPNRVDGLLMRKRLFVRPRGSQRIVDVGDLQDGSQQRDLFAAEFIGVSSAIPAFMMVSDDRQYAGKALHRCSNAAFASLQWNSGVECADCEMPRCVGRRRIARWGKRRLCSRVYQRNCSANWILRAGRAEIGSINSGHSTDR